MIYAHAQEKGAYNIDEFDEFEVVHSQKFSKTSNFPMIISILINVSQLVAEWSSQITHSGDSIIDY